MKNLEYNLTKTLELEKFASGNVRSISMNRKNLLASGSDDGTVFIWNTQTGVLVKELKKIKAVLLHLPSVIIIYLQQAFMMADFLYGTLIHGS